VKCLALQNWIANEPVAEVVVVVQEDLVVGMVVVALVRVQRLIVALVVGMVIGVATAIGVATMVDVRVVVTVIVVVLVVAISVDSVARWVLDVAPVVAMALGDSVEIVATGSALQIAAGKRVAFMPFSIGE
jgi:hypothetical protein